MRNAGQIRQYEKQLYSRMPLIGGMIRRHAASNLARSNSVQAIRALADAVIRSKDLHVYEIALQKLRQLEKTQSVNAVCAIWAATRNKELAALLSEKAWIASSPPELRVLTALHIDRPDKITGSGSAVVSLLDACEDNELLIASRARQAIHKLASDKAREALCHVVIEREHPLALEAALESGYLPKDTPQRALFLFMTEQWDRYDALDYDRQWLRKAYVSSDDILRRRIRDKLRAAGRTDFLSIIAGEGARSRAAELTGGEIELLTHTLAQNRNWGELWKLAFDVPFTWSAGIIKMLASSDWRPEPGEAFALFEELALLTTQNDLPENDERVRQIFPPALLQARAQVMGRINSVSFSPVRPIIAVGTGQRKVVLWNYQRATRERVLGDFEHSVGHAAFTANNLLVAAERTNDIDTPCSIYFWENGGETGQSFHMGQHHGSVTAIAPVGDTQLISSGRDHVVTLWQPETRHPVSTRTLHFWPRAIRVSSDGYRAVLLHRGIELVGLPELTTITEIGSDGTAQDAAFLPDGRGILVGQYSGIVSTFESPNGTDLKRQPQPVTQHPGRIIGIAVLPQRLVAITAGSEGEIRFFESGGHVKVDSGQLTSLHVSPDAAFMAVGNANASLSLFDLRSMDVLKMLLNPFAGAVPQDLTVIRAMKKNDGLSVPARNVLHYAEIILRYRFRFDIEIGDAPTIMTGEFDIEIE